MSMVIGRSSRQWLGLAMSALLALSACMFTACGRHDTNPPPLVSSERWRAYDFDSVLTTDLGEAGVLRSFTVDVAVDSETGASRLHVEGAYVGREVVQTTTRISGGGSGSSNGQSGTVTTTVECFEVKHHIVNVNDRGQRTDDAWVDVTVWIPTDNVQLSGTDFGACCRAEYVDSEGDNGTWSYHVEQAMIDEANAASPPGSLSYEPWTEGSFHGIEQSVVRTLYALPLGTFEDYARGGHRPLEEMHGYSERGPQGAMTLDCFPVTRIMGNCSLTSYEVTMTITATNGRSLVAKGSFAAQLPLPYLYSLEASGLSIALTMETFVVG